MRIHSTLARTIWPLGLFAAGLLSCSGEEMPNPETPLGSSENASAPVELPTDVTIADPANTIAQLDIIEDVTEEVADRLLTFSDKLRRRDFSAASEFLAEGFAGESMANLPVTEDRELHIGVHKITHDVSAAPILARADFLEGLKDLIGPWARVESVIWKVKGAEFGTGRAGYGKLRLYIHITGQDAAGGWVSLGSWGYGRAIRENGLWVLDRFDLESLDVTQRAGTIFTDVSTSTGVAHTGVRFGKDGNTSYAFNGAASADVNGDGLWDIFVPSNGRNYLYISSSNGTFSEEAQTRGLLLPAEGTGAVFFDFDNDGDQDLLVGHVGWENAGGQAISLYVNDGKGKFSERGHDFGLDGQRFAAYSISVFDYDQDGWLDVFVCGYGCLEVEHNNSWIEATNGAHNGLLRNLEGKGFENVADKLGLAGSSWSYASAAADYDRDGDVDLYVANDYGPNQLFRNEGDGTFEEVGEAEGVSDIGNGMGVAWGDLNADGLLDLYVSNMSSTAGNRILARLTDELDPETHALLKKLAAGNSIFLAQADGGFTRRPKSAGGLGGSWAWSPALCDLDLDGFLDVYCANGFVTGDQPFDT